MQTVVQGYRGLSFLLALNWDRMLYTVVIVAALCMSSYINLM